MFLAQSASIQTDGNGGDSKRFRSQAPEHQMKMVRQHAICQNPHGIPQLRSGQEVDKHVDITVFVKNAGRVIAPVQHVVAEIGG